MAHTCITCKAAYEISPTELQWYERVGFAPPDVCFMCDQKHRISFRNSRKLYHRTCDATGQNIISIYNKDLPYKVYRSESWYGDAWDATEMGRPFDFSRPFFEQFRSLDLAVPRLALNNVNAENSDYCNMTFGNRNCYLVFGGDFNEDVMYGTLCMHNRSSLDIDFSNECELCSDISNSIGCYACRTAFDCKNCFECAFVSDCTGCKNCVLCTDLVQKSYCLRNKQLSKEEFELQTAALRSGSFAAEKACRREFQSMLAGRVVKAAHNIACIDCTGDYQQNSKNCINAFDIYESEDLCDVIYASKSKDCFRCSLLGNDSELCYSLLSSLNAKQCRFCNFVIDSWNVDYSSFVFNCQNVFGCVGLRRKKYCFLNKQYEKEEYEALVPKIIEHMRKTPLRSSGASEGQAGEWGAYFPKSFSPFSYNESSAIEYFPMTKEEASIQGFGWRELTEELAGSSGMKTLSASSLPDNIEDAGDDILSAAIVTEASGRPFRIQKSELELYRRMHLPLPRLHPDERYRRRKTQRNPRSLWKRKCAKCAKEIESTYAPDRLETVYCEGCYLKEMY